MTRWNTKTDKNQAEIVEALRTAGATVMDMHRAGGGFPDLLVSYQGYLYLIEVKAPGGRLDEAQKRWIERHGCEIPVYIVHTIEEALNVTYDSLNSFGADNEPI